MKTINQARGYGLCILPLMILLFSCSPLPHLNVNYRLPQQTDALKGKEVFLAVEDMRTVREILGKGARKEFESFSGNISFSVARGSDSGFKIGVYDLPSLYREAFKKRLENSGVDVVTETREGQVALRIVIQDFNLDLVGRKWKVQMGYEGSLIKDGNVLAKQMISGEAERLKVVGRGQADAVLGEIFTDTMNRLDLNRLFQQAGL